MVLGGAFAALLGYLLQGVLLGAHRANGNGVTRQAYITPTIQGQPTHGISLQQKRGLTNFDHARIRLLYRFAECVDK